MHDNIIQGGIMPVNSFEHYPMSWKPVRTMDLKVPFYISLAERLEQDIVSGILIPGTKLPPQRELADYLDVNISTVSRAFKLCEQKGFICGAVGKGTFVSSDAVSNSILFGAPSGPSLIEMGAILPEAEHNRIFTDYLKTMIQEPEFHKLFQYASPENNQIQLSAAVKWLGFSGMPSSQEHILFSAGGQNGIFGILAALFSKGDRIATTPTTYPGFKLAAKALGIQLVPLTIKEGIITKEALQFVVRNENVKGLYLIPDFNNPTAETMTLPERKEIAQFLEEQQLPLIEDSINTLLVPEPQVPISAFTTQGIFLSSMSKVLSPGLRLAVLHTPEKYYTCIKQSLYAMNIAVPSMMVSLASRLILSGKSEEIRMLKQKGIRERNELLNKILEKFDVKGGLHSPLRWLMLPDKFTPDEFESLALVHGVQVYSASRFCVGATKVPNAVRIAVTAVPDIRDFERGAEILRTLLNSSSKSETETLL